MIILQYRTVSYDTVRHNMNNELIRFTHDSIKAGKKSRLDSSSLSIVQKILPDVYVALQDMKKKKPKQGEQKKKKPSKVLRYEVRYLLS